MGGRCAADRNSDRERPVAEQVMQGCGEWLGTLDGEQRTTSADAGATDPLGLVGAEQAVRVINYPVLKIR
jgi:hypothetical protein